MRCSVLLKAGFIHSPTRTGCLGPSSNTTSKATTNAWSSQIEGVQTLNPVPDRCAGYGFRKWSQGCCQLGRGRG